VSELAFQQTAQEFLSVLFESAPDAYYLYDLRGIFIDSNHAAEELIGYKKEELIGKSFLKLNLLPLQQTPKATTLLAKTVLGKDTGPDEFVLNRKNGSQVMIEIRTHPVKVNGQSLTWCITRDITKRKRMEEALRAAAQQWRNTFDAIGDVVCLLDVEGRILRCNKAMTTLLGKPFSDILGHSCCELIHSSSEPIEGSPLVRMRETRRRESMVLPVGDRWFNVSVHPLLDENDNLMGAVHIMSDITDRKRAEEQLLAYQQQLRSLASELSLAEERQQRRIAGELHDQIGQSLFVINMKLGALQEALISRSDLTLQLQKIRGLVEKANQATRSLTFALAPPVLYELGLEAGLEWLTENIHQQYGVLTEFKGYGQPKPLNDDVRVCLFRAVRELLINVAKHAQARRAKVSIWREDDEVRIEVKDDGVGFDPSELYTPEGRTRGFGLFNIRERLEFLGGHIQLKSEQGSGTRVTLVKPLKPRGGISRELT
jgi:PAS domain S-box-containing protein